MNLNYPIENIATYIGAKIIGNKMGIIKQVSFDSRSPLINNRTLFFAINGVKNDGHQFLKEFIEKGGEFAVVEREQSAIECTQLLVKNSVEALHLLAQFHREQFNIPVVAISGSNGKTTVKEWLYHILKTDFSVVRSPKSYNSQIGVPLSILEIANHHEVAIIETGVSKTGEMAKLELIIKPTIGLFTGFSSSRKQGFASVQEKNEQQMLLFKNAEVIFSSNNINLVESYLIAFNNKASILNASLAKSAAQYLKMTEQKIEEKLMTLPNISMRMEKMQGANGNILINDTYTFEETGLEIALRSVDVQKYQSKRVLILAPDINYQPTKDLHNILEASKIDVLVWIFPDKFPFNTTFTVKQISSVEKFIQKPLAFSESLILFSGARTMQLERCIPLYQLKKHITQLEINLGSVRKNLNYYRSILDSKTEILAMVKAQGYGSGSIELAKFLENEKVHALGVAYADEGIAIVKEGVRLPILVMNPEQAAFDDIIDYELEPSIYSMRILDDFLNQLILRGKERVPIHIKVDTGMHRLGFMENQISELIETLNAQPEVFVKGVFSHLAASDNTHEVDFTNSQIEKFEVLCKKIEKGIGYRFKRHLANTEGVVNYKNSHFEMVRLGIGLFGLGSTTAHLLEDTLAFRTHISQIKLVKKDDSVGYGRKYKVEKDTKIGVVPVGYADGLQRQLGNGNWKMKVNDVFVPIVGSVCMDMCMLDLTDVSCNEGDPVEIFGWQHSVAEMALKLHTIPYEIISSISSRVQRVYID